MASIGDGLFAIAIHGGAGTVLPEHLDERREGAIRADLAAAVSAGRDVLAARGSSLDAVTASVVVLEESPHFNAGHGAVFNAKGEVELDASIMDGASLRAGAVAALRRVRNPVRLARAVLERSVHVMMIGEGAEEFALEVEAEFVDPSFYFTEHRWRQLEQARAQEAAGNSHQPLAGAYFGTVGAVARDVHGHLAAATSTGGITNKRWGRIGDSPLIGAGTWADARCAVSCTGWGEYFIRVAAAHDVAARMAYRGDTLRTACLDVVRNIIPALGGSGGVVAVDVAGEIALPFNTSGMYRGYAHSDGRTAVAIFGD